MNHAKTPPSLRFFFRLLRLPASLFFFLALLGVSAGAADTGNLAGSVISTATRSVLQGAIVSIPALNRMELTNNSGQFVFQRLPPGPVDLVITYTGFDDEKRTVTVPAGGTAQVDAELRPTPAITMDAFTVSSVREGQALAVTEQRNADNIKNVTAIDAWGNLPTQNIGELAMRMPGISVPSSGGLDDDNTVFNVSIRGMDVGLTRLNIDGLPMSGMGISNGVFGRGATMHQFSSAVFEEIEIVNGQTPDSFADTIGGTLNVKTRSSFNMAERRRLRYNVSLRWAPPFFYRSPERAQKDIHPIMNADYAAVFDVLGGRRNLGISVNLSYSENVNMIDYQQLNYTFPTTPAANPPAPYMNSYSSTTGINNRHVTSVSFKADYRFSENSKYSFSAIVNRSAEPNYDQSAVNIIAGAASFDSTGTPTATSTIAPGYTPTHSVVRAVAGDNLTLLQYHWSFYSFNPTLTFSGENKWDRLAVDYKARYSYTHMDSGSGDKGQGGTLFYRVPTIGWIVDTADLNGPTFTQTAGPSVYNIANYTQGNGSADPQGRLTPQFTKRDATSNFPEKIFTGNATYLMPASFPLTLKAGFAFRDKTWDYQNRNQRQWNRVIGAPPITSDFLVPPSMFDVRQGGTRLPGVSPTAISTIELGNPALWTEDPYYYLQQKLVSRRSSREKITGGYFQAKARFGKLTLLGGLREEKTEFNGSAFVRIHTTPIITPVDNPLFRVSNDYEPKYNSGSYSTAFPSIHAVWEIAPNFKVRSSWGTSIARPGFNQLVPTFTGNDTAKTVTLSNPSLKPQYSKNLDTKLEYYFRPAGVITVSYFTKSIRDMILTQDTGVLVPGGNDNGYDGSYAGYNIWAPSNAGSVSVKGFEFNYQQQLTNLPGLLRGVTLMGNFTQLQTDGDFAGNSTSNVGLGAATTTLTHLGTGQVAGFVPKTGNVGVMYTYRNFTSRINVNYTGPHLFIYAAAETARIYRRPQTLTDVSFEYRLRPGLTLTCGINNLFQQGPKFYRYQPKYVREVRRMASVVVFGVSGQL